MSEDAWHFFLYLCVCFHTHRDAGEDEGDLDFSALLKATKKWETERYLVCKIIKDNDYFLKKQNPSCTQVVIIHISLFLDWQEEEAWKRGTRYRCVGIA